MTITLAPRWAAAAGSAAPSPAAAMTPAATETIEVPATPSSSADAGFPDMSPALVQTNTAQVPQVSPTDSENPSSWSGDPVVNYEKAQGAYPSPGLGSVDDFLLEGEGNVSPLGISLRADRRRLKSGQLESGLLVLTVTTGGPADKAGLKPYRHAARSTLEVVSVAGAFFFPPAMLLVPVLESTQIGDSYDLIVGVDGFRVTSALDFEDCMRDLQPGEVVYLSVVRNGDRLQLPVTIPRMVQ
jgi:hypothetical protein